MVKIKPTKIFSIKSWSIKAFSNPDNFFKFIFAVITIILSIILIYFLYRWAKNAVYIYRLKTDFDKLKSIGINVKNYNILYYPENKKKYIVNRTKVVGKENTLFRNKKAIGFIPDKYIVLDIDTKDGFASADFLIDYIPKDTVSEKTPNGYHYYFENDTGKPVETYVQLTIDGVKYSVDILGRKSLVTMSPTNINGKDYYWINSIFTHKPAKLSENTWLIDLIKDTKPFFRKFDNVDINLTIKGALVIVDNINIEDYFRFTFGSLKEYSKKIKLLGGIIYLYDDNYYFFTRAVFNKIKNKTYLINELKRVVELLKPSYIIDLSIIYSNYLKPSSIIQVSSAIIHNDFSNYKNIKSVEDYIQIKTISKNTKYLTTDTVTINNLSNTNVKMLINNMFENSDGGGGGDGGGSDDISGEKLNNELSAKNTNKILLGSESIYLSMFLSNHFNIPAMCLGIVSEADPKKGKIPLKEIDKLTTIFFTLF
jgi:hypothetical protein